MKEATKSVHLGHHIDEATGAVAPPIYLSTTYERDADGAYPRGHVYSRLTNPNRLALEEALAELEGGEKAAAFASGLAAIQAVFQALGAGDHVIASDDLYHGTIHVLQDIFKPWNLEVSFVDTTDLAAVKGAIRKNTKLIYVETPSNPTLKITDIASVAKLAKSQGIRLVCDNTWATPLLQKPLDLGADLVVHSTTKYFGGHSDVVGGAVITKAADEFFDRIELIQKIGGAVQSPFDSWLILRGIQTLSCRLKVHCDNAEKIAAYLADHPQVERVYYPSLASHAGYEIAQKQMKRFGGMLSFQIRGSQAEAMAFIGKLKIITRATSLGGVESLIEHRASIEGTGTKTPENLLRFSVGIEDVEDLIADLDQAFAQVKI